MSTNSIALAYCADNEATVRDIEQQLQPSAYTFHHFNCNRASNSTFLADQLMNQSDPILLFISDNFLKSAQCMSQALSMLQERRHDILPIIIDGVKEDEQTGERIQVATQFERVSDIIQYINYWQDRYLDLRREKRQLQELDEDNFNTHLRIMREISSEAGEFLRLLRSMTYLSLPEFTVNQFEQFFIFTDDMEGWEQYKSVAPRSYIPQGGYTAPEPAPLEEETEPEEEPLSESITEAHNPYEEADGPELDTSEEHGLATVDDGGRPDAEPIDGDLTPSPEASEQNQQSVEETGHQPEQEDSSPEEPEYEDEAGGQPHTEESGHQEQYLEESHNAYEMAEEEDEDEEEQPEEIAEAPQEDNEPMRSEHAIIEEALTAFNQGEKEAGMQIMTNAIAENPDSASLRYHYALMLAQQRKDYAAARHELLPVIEQEPENTDALFLLGELEELEGEFSAARKHYQQLVEVDDEYPNAHYRLGMITAAHFPEERREAARHFKQAAKQDKSNHDALYQYALLLNEVLDKPKKAIKYFRKTLKANAFHPFAYYDMALVYHQQGQYEKAADAYQKAIRVNPELRTPENDLAFQVPEPEAPRQEKSSEAGLQAGFNIDALDSLKRNIQQLEDMLQQREEETLRLREQLKEHEEQEPERPHVDQTVFVSGATSGIGRATAEVFAENGYRVILCGRRADRLELLKAEWEEAYGADCLTLCFDVRNHQESREAISTLEGKWREVDILINNAGKAKGLAPIHEGDLEHWEEMIDTNLKGLLYLTRLLTPGMVQRQHGHVINVCSTAGKEVYPDGNVYCATKFAVDALTKAMRIDLHQHNVRVGMVSPAHVDETEFALVRFDGDSGRAQIYDDFKPLSSRDVAEAIYFMVSRPAHVNVLDLVLQGTQQASSTIIDRSGREKFERYDEEE